MSVAPMALTETMPLAEHLRSSEIPKGQRIMRTKVQALFTLIEDQMSEMSYEERRDVCNLLSALRGPDSNNLEAKVFTGMVRMSVFPRLCISLDDDAMPNMERKYLTFYEGISGVPWSCEVAPLTTDNWKVEQRLRELKESAHFRNHIDFAINALSAKDGE